MNNMGRKRKTALFCAVILLVCSLAVQPGDAVYGKKKKPALSKKSVLVKIGKTAKIKVKNAKGMKITWKRNKKIVTVKKSGRYAAKIKAKHAGTAKVTAVIKKGKKKYRRVCRVIVPTSCKRTPHPSTASPTPKAPTASPTPKAPDNPTTSTSPTVPDTPTTSTGPTVPDKPTDPTNPTASDNPTTSTSPTVSDNPTTSATPKSEKTERITLSENMCMDTAALDGAPVYNADGSVTVTVKNEYGGGGIAFYLREDKKPVDVSAYKALRITVSAKESTPLQISCYADGDNFWSEAPLLGYGSAETDKRVLPYSLNACPSVNAVRVRYNSWNLPAGATATLTIHSIELERDLRDISGAVSDYEPLSELADRYGFKMGTVISSTTVTDSLYNGLMKYHFNSLTAANETKAYSMLDQNASKTAWIDDETSMAKINFTRADEIMEFARDNQIRMRGHVLVWDADMCDWFFRKGYDSSKEYASADIIKKRVQNYIEQVLTHFEEKYPGLIYCWDVVNEAVGDSAGDYAAGDARHVRTMRSGKKNLFYETMGKDYVELSFQYARETIDKLKQKNPNLDTKLYYNDYNTFYAEKRDAICELVKSINTYKSDGRGGYVRLCDGVGMQSYIGGFGQQSGCMNDGDISKVREAIQKYADLGMEVQVTEMAVRNYQSDAETLERHAEFYEKLFRVYMEANAGASKPIKAVCIWGIVDAPDMNESDYSYRMNGPYCGLFNEYLGVKPAFIRVYNLLKNGQ